jgi:hypothetical protein
VLSGRQFSLGLRAACTDGAARAIEPASMGGSRAFQPPSHPPEALCIVMIETT